MRAINMYTHLKRNQRKKETIASKIQKKRRKNQINKTFLLLFILICYTLWSSSIYCVLYRIADCNDEARVC